MSTKVKSIRLTVDLRNRIKRSATEKAFHKAFKTITDKIDTLCTEYAKHSYPKGVSDAQFDSLVTSNWLNISSTMNIGYIESNGRTVSINYSAKLKESIYTPKHQTPSIRGTLINEQGIPWNKKEEFVKLLEQFNDLDRESQKLRNSIGTLLESCTTTAKVAEILPELIEFLPKEETLTGSLVPSEEIQKVREMLKPKD